MRMRAITIFVIILVLLHAFSCSKMQVDLDPTKSYKMEIEIKNLDREAAGMMWLPRKELYTLEIFAEEKMDILSFRTCSREEIIKDPKTIFNRKKFVYNYRPNEIESSTSCPVYINALNTKGYTQSAFIDIIDQTTTLPAHVVCGKITEDVQGISVCQERAQSTESISFDVDVITSPEKGCELESGNKGKIFEFNMKKGFCSYVFIETKSPYRLHRLTTYGYSDVLFRE